MMGVLNVYVAAEDPATIAVVERLLSDYCGEYEIINNIPARGGKLKSIIPALNNLADSNPVILLMDLDAEDCPPILKEKLLNNVEKKQGLIFNIAVDEVEAWLMADRANFANFLGVSSDLIPESKLTRMNGPKDVLEVCCPVKSSFYLTHTIAQSSSKKEIKEFVAVNPMHTAVKGTNYNDYVLLFIRKLWNPESARNFSDSLDRMIRRITELKARQ